ncbi:MAG: cadherin-like beta sandwich domain-containing protein, partial [bacterium]|nr:cadherin-like beta sandwich domain-containing protein [bacterium]
MTRAAAPAADVLVSNTGRPNNTNHSRDYAGQDFTTGPNPGGYTIDQVGIQITGDNTGEALLRVYTANGIDPGRLLYTFTDPPGGFTRNSTNYFDAPANAVLAPNTRYVVVLSNDAGNGRTGIEYRRTAQDNEDSGSLAGWSIGNIHTIVSNTTVVNAAIKIRVRGRANADPTLRALALEDAAGGTAIALNETFAAATTSYTADVTSGVERLTVDPTKADADAIVTFLDGSDRRLDDADLNLAGFQLALAEGANTVKVKVTASDRVATRTYALTVTRPADTTAPSLESAEVADAALVLTFDEDLAPAASLANASFAVKKTPQGGVEQAVALTGTPAIDGRTVTLTLASPAAATDDGFKVSYTRPRTGTDNALEDAAGNEVASFTDESAANTGPPSTDATLSGLALEDADGTPISLNETFAAATLSYTADVPDAVGSVTVTTAAGHAGATLAFLDAGDAALTDADLVKAGFQLALAEGANTLKVKVTAEDGNAMRTYTLTVTRAAAPAAGELVSNTGRSHVGAPAVRHYAGQDFTTGPNPGGYILDQIGIAVTGDRYGQVLVRVYTANGIDPGRLLYSLADPASLRANATNYFDAPANAVLEPNTRYVVVISNNAGTGSPTIQYRITTSDNEDSGAAPGWSIGNRYTLVSNSTVFQAAIKIRVLGRVNADPTLSALDLEDAGAGTAIALNETFAAATTSYTADVTSGVERLTVDPTKADADAIVTFLDGSDRRLDDADLNLAGFQLALAEGANTVKVKVTASDRVATRTYALTVTR